MRRAVPLAAFLALVALAGCGGSGSRSSTRAPRTSTTARTGTTGADGATGSTGTGATGAQPSTGVRPSNPAFAPTTTTVVTDPQCRGANQRVDRDVAYATPPAGVDPSLLSLDVYAPVRDAACPRTHVLVSVHRGAWRDGDKRDVGQRAALALREGWVLVSVNHRTAPAAKYPTFDDDVAAAIAWVRTNIARYGGDPAHITLLGTESGAVISAETTTDARHLARAGQPLSAIRCSVLADGQYDIGSLGRTGSPAVLAAYGTDPRVWSDASAIGHIAPGTGMARLLVIVRGTPAERASGTAIVNRARAGGTPATLLATSAFSGPALDAAIGGIDETFVTPAITEFIRSC